MIFLTEHRNNNFNRSKDSDHVLRWILPIELYGLTFEYFPGIKQKNVDTLADALSRLDIDILNIQEEEALYLLSGSENNSISNIKSTIPLHTELNHQRTSKSRREKIKRKGLSLIPSFNKTY
jgi:hypothetical protein